MARENDPAPGLAGLMLGTSGGPALLLNDEGETAFRTSLRGAGVSTANDEVILSEHNGSVAPVAREGDVAAGVAGGAMYRFLSGLALGDDHVAFTSSLVGGGVTNANDTGLWRSDGVVVSLLAREGSQAPGAPAGSKLVLGMGLVQRRKVC